MLHAQGAAAIGVVGVVGERGVSEIEGVRLGGGSILSDVEEGQAEGASDTPLPSHTQGWSLAPPTWEGGSSSQVENMANTGATHSECSTPLGLAHHLQLQQDSAAAHVGGQVGKATMGGQARGGSGAALGQGGGKSGDVGSDMVGGVRLPCPPLSVAHAGAATAVVGVPLPLSVPACLELSSPVKGSFAVTPRSPTPLGQRSSTNTLSAATSRDSSVRGGSGQSLPFPSVVPCVSFAHQRQHQHQLLQSNGLLEVEEDGGALLQSSRNNFVEPMEVSGALMGASSLDLDKVTAVCVCRSIALCEHVCGMLRVSDWFLTQCFCRKLQ